MLKVGSMPTSVNMAFLTSNSQTNPSAKLCKNAGPKYIDRVEEIVEFEFLHVSPLSNLHKKYEKTIHLY